MSLLRHAVLLTGALLVANAHAQQLGGGHWNTLKQYCSKCHNTDD